MKTRNIIKLAVVAALVHGATASAQTYNYATGDLLAAFGRSGSSPAVIVDLGSASLYQNATGSFNIAGVNATLLTTALGSLDGIYWTVFGYVNSTSSSLGAQNTIFVSQARADVNIANDPNSSLTFSGQGQVISKMTAIAHGAASGYATVLDNQIVSESNTLNVGGDPVSFTVGVGPLFDYNGTWAPNVKNQTPIGFSTGSVSSVSDLFQQNPGAANVGNYLGNFQFNNDGTLAFNSVTPVPEPSTWAMFGAGLLALVGINRSRK
jgi:hypothetical protein